MTGFSLYVWKHTQHMLPNTFSICLVTYSVYLSKHIQHMLLNIFNVCLETYLGILRNTICYQRCLDSNRDTGKAGHFDKWTLSRPLFLNRPAINTFGETDLKGNYPFYQNRLEGGGRQMRKSISFCSAIPTRCWSNVSGVVAQWGAISWSNWRENQRLY